MRRYLNTTALLFAGFSLTSCLGGGGGGGGGDDAQEAAVFGVVVDVEGNPISGANVRFGSASAATGADGAFEMRASVGQGVVEVRADGYVESFAPVTVYAEAASALRVTLLERSEAGTLDVATGGEVTGADGASLVAPPNAFVGAAGPVTGQATVYLSPIEADNPAELAAAPGDFTGETGEGVEMIESFGMMDITVMAGDEELAIADGASVEVRFPAPEGEVPTEIALWSFDEEAGRWIEEGTATYDESTGTYVANIEHLSWWNCDQVLETTCACGRAVDEDGNPITGARVTATGVDYNGSSSATTDEEGRFCIAVRKDSTVNVLVSHAEGGGLVREVVSGSEDTDVPPEMDDARCLDWGEWEVERGVVEFPDGSEVDCEGVDFPLMDCAPTFTEVVSCYNPSGACTVSGFGNMTIEYENGARIETETASASDSGATTITRYFGAGGVPCGSQTSETVFSGEDEPVVVNVTTETESGSSARYGYTYQPDSSDVTYTCEDGSTFTITAADQQVLEACYGGGGEGEGGEDEECTREGGEVTPGTPCSEDSECGSLVCCMIGEGTGYCLQAEYCEMAAE